MYTPKKTWTIVSSSFFIFCILMTMWISLRIYARLMMTIMTSSNNELPPDLWPMYLCIICVVFYIMGLLTKPNSKDNTKTVKIPMVICTCLLPFWILQLVFPEQVFEFLMSIRSAI